MTTNEMNLSIYVPDEEIEYCFDVIRPELWDEDLYNEKCDSIEMSDNDIDIAFIRKGNIQYTLFTSCDRWNVYMIKEECNEYNVWETKNVENITHDIDNWENIQGLTNYLLDLNFKKIVLQKNIVEFLENKIQGNKAILSDAYWLDFDTFYISFAFSPEELKMFFPNKIQNNENCHLCAEYHEDEHKFVYELIFDCDRINVANEMQSHIIDWYILEQARKILKEENEIMKYNNKIIIVVKDGLVEDVYGSDKKIDVEIIDLDTTNEERLEELQNEVNYADSELYRLY